MFLKEKTEDRARRTGARPALPAFAQAAAVAGVMIMTYSLPALSMGKPMWGSHDKPHGGGSSGGPGGSNKGAPGPIAGAGLPFVLIAGGYTLVRMYRRRSRAG